MIVAAVALLVAVIAVWIVAFSSILGVKTIDVRGTSTLTADQVRAAAGIAHGAPLVRLDSSAIEHRVERLPLVASAIVRTGYPNTVVITVVERVAVGYVESGAGFVLVDRTGDQFRSVASRPRAVPLFALPDGAGARSIGGGGRERRRSAARVRCWPRSRRSRPSTRMRSRSCSPITAWCVGRSRPHRRQGAHPADPAEPAGHPVRRQRPDAGRRALTTCAGDAYRAIGVSRGAPAP